VRLGDALVVGGVNLAVRAGEAVALMGPNGSGKSTLVRALVGVLPPASGSIHLFGVDLLARRAAVPWHRIGYVPQRFSVSTGVPASALEVVVSGLLAGRRLRPPRDATRRALAALAQVDLADRARDVVRTLSGGQQQRVLIARALVREPRLLVLDEPVAGVDQPSQDAFARTLHDLVAREVTVLVVLHELGPLAGLVRRTVVLRHGAVAYDGPPRPPAREHAGAQHVHLHAHEDRSAAGPLGAPVLGGWS
jgi:zinc transport system ATP-binding protein